MYEQLVVIQITCLTALVVPSQLFVPLFLGICVDSCQVSQAMQLLQPVKYSGGDGPMSLGDPLEP